MSQPLTFRQKPRPVGFETTYTLDGGKLTMDSTRRVDEVDLSRVVEARFHQGRQTHAPMEPRGCLASWLPGVGDPLCAVAGWLQMPLWPCTFYMAVGKFLRYLAMTSALLWVF